MGQFFDQIPENLQEWVLAQHLFWVSTAPLDKDGHVNVSPKGLSGSFHVVNANQVWYEDNSGSGVETISHLRENGRITVMFCAFEGPPRIVRLFGKGTVHEFGTPEYERLLPDTKRRPGSRSAIVIDVHRVGSSCGYGVPFYDYKSERTSLIKFSVKFEDADRDFNAQVVTLKNQFPPSETGNPPVAPNGLRAYWFKTNQKSIDGLPGLDTALRTDKSFISQAGVIDAKGSEDKQAEKESSGYMVDGREVRAFVLGALVAVAAVRVYNRMNWS